LSANQQHTDRRSILETQRGAVHRWETIKDIVDQLIDMMLNFRQSGHPGGSHSKVHALIATMPGGVARVADWIKKHSK